MTPLLSLRVLSNMRLKLAAPVFNEFGLRTEMRYCRIPFVKTPAGRRSLSAIR